MWTRVAWGSCWSIYLRVGSLLVLIQQMSSQRRKPHLRRQCRPASSPSALPHLRQPTNPRSDEYIGPRLSPDDTFNTSVVS